MPKQPRPASSDADLAELADITAAEARQFSLTIADIASGASPETALSIALLATADVVAIGARLGAISDVILDERYEPDDGEDADLARRRAGLAPVLEGPEEFADRVAPDTSAEVTTGCLSTDFAVIVGALDHGLTHYDQGHVTEALWWWQFSYLSDWGERASMALRVLLGLLAHVRLDADADLIAEAEFDALHP